MTEEPPLLGRFGPGQQPEPEVGHDDIVAEPKAAAKGAERPTAPLPAPPPTPPASAPPEPAQLPYDEGVPWLAPLADSLFEDPRGPGATGPMFTDPRGPGASGPLFSPPQPRSSSDRD